MENCVFCKIARGETEASIVYEDGDVVAFDDLNPKAPVHILVIPRRHIERLSDAESADRALLGGLVLAAAKIAKEKGIASSGFRVVFNCNKDAGQEVFHLHAHLLGGRKLGWPPG